MYDIESEMLIGQVFAQQRKSKRNKSLVFETPQPDIDAGDSASKWQETPAIVR